MTEIKIVGKRQIGDTEITHIEGGFGENCKCVLAKDIAEKHSVETKYINQIVNRNKSRFNNKDLIDLKNNNFEVALSNHGIFSQNSLNRANNIYLFSERGYIKLVSMMDNTNETKWIVMQEFIDSYFKIVENA